MKLGLVTLVMSVAALIGLAYNQYLYREAIRKINELEKKTSLSKNDLANKQAVPYKNSISDQVSITKKSAFSSESRSVENTIAQKTQQHNPDSEKFYSMFKDAINRYEKEMKEKYNNTYSKQYMKSRLNRYKKRLNINDMQWQYVGPILTDYLQELDRLRREVFRRSEEESDDHSQKLLDEQQKLKDEYAKKLTPYLTNQQIDDFRSILIQ